MLLRTMDCDITTRAVFLLLQSSKHLRVTNEKNTAKGMQLSSLLFYKLGKIIVFSLQIWYE